MVKKQVLFVCVENSNRSQMAEAFAKMWGSETVESFSAGSKPSGVVNPKAISAMRELDYDLSKHTSKSLDEIPDQDYDAVITMGCGDNCPFIVGKIREDWTLADPKHMLPNEFRIIRDEIGRKVQNLLGRI